MLYADGDGDADAARRELKQQQQTARQKRFGWRPERGGGLRFPLPCCFVDAEIRFSPPSLQEGEQRMSILSQIEPDHSVYSNSWVSGRE